MDRSDRDDPLRPPGGERGPEARKAVERSRLARALRANLNRRKAQSRARAAGAGSGAADKDG